MSTAKPVGEQAMSTVIAPNRSLEKKEQIFRYGWRHVQRLRDDGTTTYETVPLTLEDTLHPQQGDYIVEGTIHDETRRYLADVFWTRVDRTNTFVFSDCGVYWDRPEKDHHCPDIAIVRGLDHPEKLWKCESYQVAEFGVRPQAIFEIVSRNVRNNDVETKFHDYHELQIALFVIIDREKSDTDWKIVPYQYAPDSYVKLPTDDRGRFWIDFLGIWIGVKDERVVCFDGKTDAVIGDYSAVTHQLETEKQRAEAAEAKLKAMEEEVARVRGK
jgi:Uma2 family endonuclease